MRWVAMPLAPLAAAFAAGIALGPWAPAEAAWAVYLVALSTGILALASGNVRATAWATLPLLIAGAALGALRAGPPPLPDNHVAHLQLPSAARVAGRLVAEPTRFAADRLRLLLEVERVDDDPRVGRVQVTAYGEPPALTAGQRVAAETRLYRAQGLRNPGGFDYGASLAREGIHVVGTVRAERVVPLDDPAPPWPTRVRRGALAAMERALPPVSAALLAGLLLGERAGLPPDVDAAFRRAGVYHILAVSGFNVALLAAAVFTLATLARIGRRATALAALVVVLAFAAVVGPEPSVLRATVMAALVLTALLLEREAAVLNSLGLAALLILAVRPGDLADPGFQLSFAATLGIVVAPLPRGPLLGALGVSVAAQLAVLPITLVHFNQLSTIGVLANLVVVPLASVATVVGLGAVALAFLSEAVAAVAFDAVWPVLLGLRVAVALAADVPGALVHLPAPHWTAVVAYAAALLLALGGWRLREDRPRLARRLAASAVASMSVALAIGAWPLVRPADGRLRVTVLDVGQGDAIVVEAPDGRALVIDAGGGGPMRLDAGERVVAPYLWNRGVLRLAGAVTTHADADHAGGMAAVRRLFRVDDVLTDRLGREPVSIGGVAIRPLSADGPAPSPLPAPPRCDEGHATGREPSAFFTLPRCGEAREGGGCSGECRSEPRSAPRPRAAARSATTRQNEEALVLRLDFGLASFLLASDIGAATEGALLAAGAPLAATVLKVAHHGSQSSSTIEFLAAVRPTVAVISVGPRNPYGHPGARTLERLGAVGASVYRTDRDGALILETDGRALTVTRWSDRRVERYCLDPDANAIC